MLLNYNYNKTTQHNINIFDKIYRTRQLKATETNKYVAYII